MHASVSRKAQESPAPLLGAEFGIVIATAVAYWGTLAVPFVFDDQAWITSNPSIQHLRSIAAILSPPAGSGVGGRPVLSLSLAANYALSGHAPWGYHLANLAIHCLAALTLFGIVRRTLAYSAATFLPGRDRILPAFAVALLWALHPLQTEAVTYVSQRAESLMGLFYLLTLYCFIRGAQSAHARGWHVLSVLSCLLGMATKEVMVTAPLIVLAYDRTFVAGGARAALRLRWRVYLGYALTWLMLGFLMTGLRERGVGYGLGYSWWSYALTECWVISHYILLALWPHPLVFDYGRDIVSSVRATLPWACLLAVPIGAALAAFRQRTALGFVGVWFFLILAPTSSVVPVALQPMAEHRMYLPLASVAVLAVTAIHRWIGRAALPLCLLLSAALFVTTWDRNRDYHSAEGLWADTVAKRPGNYKARNNLGVILSNEPGRLNDAVAQFEAALRLRPDEASLHINLGLALSKVPARLNDAAGQYQEALRREPDNVSAHIYLGNALLGMPQRLNDAIAQYEGSLRLDPDSSEAHFGLGIALSRMPGRLNDAIAQYQEALRLDPNYFEARNNLGNALLKVPGRLNDAIAQFEEALRLKPDDVLAHINLGSAFLGVPGRLNDSIAQFEVALRLNPDSPEAHLDLGIALSRVPGRLNDAIAQCREALRLNPGLAQAHYCLAMALIQVPGRGDEAKAHLGEVLRLQPTNEPAREMLRLIQESRP